MGTAWIIASSTTDSTELAVRIIVGAVMAIAVLILLYVALRKRLSIKYTIFSAIVLIITIATLLLLSDTIAAITGQVEYLL